MEHNIMGLDSKLLYKELEMQIACIKRNEAEPIVKLGFDDRIKIWTGQILPDRLNKIAQENSVEYVNRMIGLLGADVHRLAAACDRQHDQYEAAPRMERLMRTYRAEILAYASEISRIEDMDHDH